MNKNTLDKLQCVECKLHAYCNMDKKCELFNINNKIVLQYHHVDENGIVERKYFVPRVLTSDFFDIRNILYNLTSDEIDKTLSTMTNDQRMKTCSAFDENELWTIRYNSKNEIMIEFKQPFAAQCISHLSKADIMELRDKLNSLDILND